MVDILESLEKKGGAFKSDIGRVIAVPPLGQDTEFNFTLPMGKGTEMWISFLINLEKKGYLVKKLGEDLEVSPVDAGYYNITQKQKEEMEIRIKQGLASVSSAVSDYELISHDVRKYKELLKMLETKDEHGLRTIFVDDVDIGTGNNAIKTAVQRWPTLISDFITLGEKMPSEEDVDKIKEGLHISRAEAVILATKQKLYHNWLEFFGSEVKERFSRLLAQQNSRKRTIDEYKNWIKPLIARYKLHKESFSNLDAAKATLITPYHSPGQAFSLNNITIWAWQSMVGIEPRIGTLEKRNRGHDKGFGIDPYDNYIQENFIFNTKEGLAKDYPWINKDWVKDNVNIVKKEWMKDNRLYYVLLQVDYSRSIMKSPAGGEFEDMTFKTKMWFLSQNALLVALLKLKAEQEKFDREINQLLGISNEDGQNSSDEVQNIIKKWKDEAEQKNKGRESENETVKKVKENIKSAKKVSENIIKMFGLDEIRFSRNRPYEHDFEDRITNIYLVHTAKDFYLPHVAGYLSQLAGVGK